MKKMRFSLTAVLILGFCIQAYTQSTSSHSIRIRILRTNTIALHQKMEQTESNLLLSDPAKKDRNSVFHLKWKTSDTKKKVTVACDLTPSKGYIRVLAKNTTCNTVESEVIVDKIDKELIKDVKKTNGHFALIVQTDPKCNNKPGSKINTITYTLIDT